MLAKSDDSATWHVVHSDMRHAPCAIEAMRKVGYEVYYPQMRVLKPPRRDRLSAKQRNNLAHLARPVLAPLFGGYMFVLFDISTGRWHELFDLFGVNGMIVNGGLPAPVARETVESLRALEIGGAIPLDMPVQRLLFGVGQKLRIEDGPFRGFDGTVQQLDESKRRVLLDIVMLGSARTIAFDAEQVSAI